MKTTLFFPLGRRRYLLVIVNLFLAIGLTMLSFRYVQPQDCYRFCGEEVPCPAGSCRWGEQKAGWPLPTFVDAPGGGSPTGGWGLLGPEDLPLGMPMILDVLFYSILIWLAVFIIGLIQRQILDPKLILLALPMTALLAVFLWMFYFLFGFVAGFHIIGRGRGEQVYMVTPRSTASATGFSPFVSIPLEELIENYGEPDYVWFTSAGPTELTTTGMVLYWTSINLFVELPQVANKTYAVHKRTAIEMIIFFDDPFDYPDVTIQDLTAVGEKSISGEQIAWTGYGNYQK
jgi:hypothetical protein